MPYPPEQWTQAWRDAVMLNQLDDVAPLVDDALAARDLTMSTDTVAWRLLCRLSLVVASRAHSINARREWGDYAGGWPQSAGVPASELPGETEMADTMSRPASPPEDPQPSPSRPSR